MHSHPHRAHRHAPAGVIVSLAMRFSGIQRATLLTVVAAVVATACDGGSSTSASNASANGAGGATSAGGAATSPGGGRTPERPTGALTLRKAESHFVEINAGQTHEWGIDLTAGERVTFAITADSTGATMCQSWTWGFYNPAGGTLREEPARPDDAGHWTSTMPQSAEASIAEGPTAGRYTVRVSAGSDCPQLRYTLSAQ